MRPRKVRIVKSNEQFVSSIILRAILLLIVESIILLIFFENFIPLFLGLILGGAISIIFFRTIYLNILYAIEKTEAQAKRFMTINYIVRYFISGLVLFVSGRSDYLNIFTCLIGLLTIKFTLYIYNLTSFFKERKGQDGH